MSLNEIKSFQRTILGRTGLEIGRLGLGALYGVPTKSVERAFERGVNYFYWATRREEGYGQAIRNLAHHRDRFVLVLQSSSPIARVIVWSVERALRDLRLDHADILVLGMWNRPVPPRIMEACRELKNRGLVRFLGLSTHHRPIIPKLATTAEFDVFHVRYNAVHRGAERDVFPFLCGNDRPGLVSFTATCWRQLLGERRVFLPAHRGITKGERIPTAADCYRFVLSHPAVNVCLAGPSSAAQMEQALEALHGGPMSDEELAWMCRVGDSIYAKDG